jgi:hypothetical protein
LERGYCNADKESKSEMKQVKLFDAIFGVNL